MFLKKLFSFQNAGDMIPMSMYQTYWVHDSRLGGYFSLSARSMGNQGRRRKSRDTSNLPGNIGLPRTLPSTPPIGCFLLTTSLLPIAHYDGDAPLPTSLKAPMKSQKKIPNNLCSLDMGIIDLTTFWADSEDDNVDAMPLKPPKKRWKIDISHSIDHFLDTSVLDDEEEEDYSGDDTLMACPSEVLPGGLASFTSCIDDICRLYSGHANRVHDTLHDPPCHSPLSMSQTLPRVYKVNIITGMHQYIYCYHN